MVTRTVAVCVGLLFASIARAGAVIELVPDNPGPYFGGESVNVDFLLRQEPAGDPVYIRLMQFDTSGDGLTLNSFRFDYSARLICELVPSLCVLPGEYQECCFPCPMCPVEYSWGIYSAVFVGLAQDSMSQLLLPGDGRSITVGHMSVTLPAPIGNYTLDVLNERTSDPATGSARVHFGFGGPTDPVTEWSGANGLVTGGIYTFEVIPEPVTLVMLAIGGGVMLRQRASCRLHRHLPSRRMTTCIGPDPN